MQEVQLSDLISYLRAKTLFILTITFTISIISALVSLNLQEIYASDALVQISQDASSSNSNLSSTTQGLASFAGIDLSSSENSKKTGPYFLAKVKSRFFFEHLLTFDGILEGIVAGNSFDISSGRIILDKNLYDQDSKKWIRKVSGNQKTKPSSQEAHRIFLSQLKMSSDKKTGFISIVYEHSSPYFSKKIIELIIKEVNKMQKNEDLFQYDKEMKYLIEQKNNNSIVFLEKSISNLIMNLIQDQTLANVKDEYLVEYIDPPHIPESREWPKRTAIVLVTTILSFILLIFFLAFYKFIYSKTKK